MSIEGTVTPPSPIASHRFHPYSTVHAHYYCIVTEYMLPHDILLAGAPIPAEVMLYSVLRPDTYGVHGRSIIVCTHVLYCVRYHTRDERDIIPDHLFPLLFSFGPVRSFHPDEEALMTGDLFHRLIGHGAVTGGGCKNGSESFYKAYGVFSRIEIKFPVMPSHCPIRRRLIFSSATCRISAP